MIDIEDAQIQKLIYHRINVDDTKPVFSETLYELNYEEEEELLKKIFLKPFASNFTTYEFMHEIDMELNPLFKLSQSIYVDADFINNSKSIGQHLKSVSKHPNIKDGDLFIIKFDDVIMNKTHYEALGIYKIETKESFIETSEDDDGPSLDFKKGIGTRRLDKACLIVYTDEPYTVLMIDNASSEADYWQNEFAKVDLKKDNVNNTSQFLTLAKTFVTEQFPTDFEVTRADQIGMLNRSVSYFKSHEYFDKNEFEKEVFNDKEVIQSFQTFDSVYREENDVDIADDFSISQQAVKKQARVFKSVLKLDKNFHVYIHGNRNLIEQGKENDGRKFYKLYFEEES